ncbi:hypothetical protein [Maritimibacter dapengensis]|uniref:Uncharacterized protein n=1 Tax=Maritimibacter dapengensis TaxID=2836868 RepID=A0ABS6T0H8_9RHOB|nr:hypothetical protein [Maritimibacter dapengensis]MBV7378614.1 hypothetical protein [Maritimibacter dapengensis]
MSGALNWLETHSVVVELTSIFVALLSLLATLSIAIVLDRIRRGADSVQNTNALNRQWQEFNLHMIEHPQAFESLRALGYEKGTDEELRQRHIVYYILNMLYDSWHLDECNAVKGSFADTTIRGQLGLLSERADLVRTILADENLYDKDFAAYCLRVLEEVTA